jgi:uncharacterized protein DUF4350
VTAIRASAVGVSALLLTFGAGAAAFATDSPSPTPSNGVDTSTLAQPSSDDALLNLLGEQGIDYQPVTTLDAAADISGPDSTLVIDPGEIPDQTTLGLLAQESFGRIIILNDDANTLGQLTVGVGVAQSTATASPATVQPGCGVPDAAAAGRIDLEESTATFDIAPGTPGTGCYQVGGAPAFVQTDAAQGTGDVIVLGTTAPFENQYLASAGNAALGLRIFGAHPNLVWWAPSFTPDSSLNNCSGVGCQGLGSGGQPTAPQNGGTVTEGPAPQQAGGGQPTLTSLMPSWIWWALLQLIVAALLTAYWRARRLGRVVTEELPVTVRAAETVEGHARLYRRANAHGRAAELLRRATASRLAGYFGIPAARAHADPSLLVAPVAARLETPPQLIGDLLAGEVPESEAELVLLADHLDLLEKEVRSS